jgi:hypothetical protein
MSLAVANGSTAHTVDTLAAETSNGNITGYTVDYRDSEGELRLQI